VGVALSLVELELSISRAFGRMGTIYVKKGDYENAIKFCA
jgi:hypothetical protein